MSKQAIDGQRINAFLVDPEILVIVGLDTTDDGTDIVYDDRAHWDVDESLGYNIAAEGNIVPVIVRKNGERVEVVDGRQRVKAARWINQKLVAQGKEPIRLKVMVEKGEDHHILGVLISANEHRRADTPMSKARKLARYLQLGRSEREASVTFGVVPETIKLWGRLLDLHPKIQAAVDEGHLSAHAASQLADLQKDEQIAKFDELSAESASTGKKITAKATRTKSGKAGPKGPGRREVAQVFALLEESKDTTIPREAVDIFAWVTGKETDPKNLPGWLVRLITASGDAKPGEEPVEDGEGLDDANGSTAIMFDAMATS